MLNLETFVKTINDIENVVRYHDDLNNFFRKNKVDGYIFQPDCVDTTIDLLNNIFRDIDNWISYFCFDLDFGKKWKTGMVQDEHGNDIRLKNAEDLWKLLCENNEEKK